MKNEESLDLSILSELLILQEEGESDIIEEMMSFYLIDAAERLIDIRQALDLNDAQWLIKAIHKLKGSSSQMGAARMTSFCSEMGMNGQNIECQNLKDTLALMEEELIKFRQIVESKPWKKMSNLNSIFQPEVE